MPTRYGKVPCCALQRWRGPFAPSILDELEREGARLAVLLVEALHGEAPSFAAGLSAHRTRSDAGWPKYVQSRAVGLLRGEKVVELRAEYVDHNPRDGQSWELGLLVWLPGGRRSVELSAKDGASTSCFELILGEEDPELERHVHAAIARFDQSRC